MLSSTAVCFVLRRIDDDKGRTYELAQSAVKCMRGILKCWIRQAEKVVQIINIQPSSRSELVDAKQSLSCVFCGTHSLPESSKHAFTIAVWSDHKSLFEGGEVQEEPEREERSALAFQHQNLQRNLPRRRSGTSPDRLHRPLHHFPRSDDHFGTAGSCRVCCLMAREGNFPSARTTFTIMGGAVKRFRELSR